MKQPSGEAGFTLVEVMIAIIVLTIGLLGLMGTAALVTRMIGRGQRSAVAGIEAAQRFEQLRATGCRTRADGSEQFYRGATVIGRNDWAWTTAGTNMFRLTVRTTYTTTQGRQRSETREATISCVR
ncbi:MAG: type IV pilus modification PilV family protein [Candidatus Methylomirabilaceae bacterium]